MKTLSFLLLSFLTSISFFGSGQQLPEIDNLKKQLLGAGSDTARIRLYRKLANSYPDQQLELALDAERRALTLAEKLKDRDHIIRGLTNIASLFRRHSKYPEAISNLKKAVTHSTNPNDDPALTNTYLEFGIAYLRMTHLDSSQLFLDRGLAIAIHQHDLSMEASFYNMIGNVLKERRNFKEATEFYLKATTLFEKIHDDHGLTQALSNVGNLQNLMGNTDKALEYALQSLRIAEKINQRTSIAYSHRLLGRIYKKQKNYTEATKAYDKAAAIYKELDAKMELSETFTLQGNIFYEKLDFVSATKAYKNSLTISKKIYDPTNMAYSYAALGSTMFELRELRSATRYFDSAISVAKRINLPLLVMDGYEGLSLVNAQAKNYKLAHEYHIKFYQLKDSLAQVENRQSAAELEARYQSDKKENEIRTLNAENEIKELQLQKQQSQRNYLIGLVILSLLLIAVLYNRYSIKQKASKKLEELDEIKSRFFANISHEFRTPLSLILGPLQQKIQSTVEPREKEELLLMKRNADRLHSLINQLLDLSKIESGMMKLQVEKNNIIPFINLMHASFASLADQKQIVFRLEGIAEPISAFFDRDKLEKILFNLLSNAFKFTPAEGVVILLVTTVNNDLIIQVKDSGPGIPADKIQKIFDRFYQVDSSTHSAGGTGVGLALAKELSEVHHGKLTVESSPGNGCEFTLRIPLSRTSYKNEITGDTSSTNIVHLNEDRAPEPSIPEDIHTDWPTILIAEDNHDMRSFIANTLKDQYRILAASDGQDALEKAIAQVPDLVISDWMMPRMDGNTLCEKLKKHGVTSHVPVIILTAKADQHSKLEGLQTGADDYLTKPFDAHELMIRVNNLIVQRKKLRELFRQQIIVQPRELDVKSPDAEFLDNVLATMESRYADPLFGVEEFTREIGLSRMQLHRKLKALTDHSPGEFLRQFRLERAKQMLKLPGIQVSEVAYQTGFNNLSNFTKAFKDFTGQTPSEFRQNADFQSEPRIVTIS